MWKIMIFDAGKASILAHEVKDFAFDPVSEKLIPFLSLASPWLPEQTRACSANITTLSRWQFNGWNSCRF